MTLKQAIRHAREVGNIEFCQNDSEVKCAGEHRQLARWLEELQWYRQRNKKTVINENPT